jgi:hypothetical protein
MSAQTFLVAADARRVIFKPQGRCSAVLGNAIRQYFRRLPPDAGCDVYFDLSNADMLESTFAGLLLSLARQRGSTAVAAVHLVRPSSVAVSSLRNMNVLSFFDVCESADGLPDTWIRLAADAGNPDELAELIIRAHETLIAADSRNEAAFGPVVRGFAAARDAHTPPA